MSAGAVEADAEAFARLLAADGSAWGAAKRDAFLRLREAFPDGPRAEGLRQLRRGQFDARLPREWKPVFLEAYVQWLGFREERELARPGRFPSARWWRRPAYVLGLPRPLRPLAAPLALAFVAVAALAWREAHVMAARRDAALAVSRVLPSVEAARAELADVETLAERSLQRPSDDAIASFLAAEPSVRSRHASWRARQDEVRQRLVDAKLVLEETRFPRW